MRNIFRCDYFLSSEFILDNENSKYLSYYFMSLFSLLDLDLIFVIL